MNERNIRINKVLRELNISLEKAVNILKSADVIIESNPNTKISAEEYNFLLSYEGLTKSLGLTKRETKIVQKITSRELLNANRGKKEIPNSVFKFFGTQEYSISSLKENYLFHADYNSFNDPFDCNKELLSFSSFSKTTKQQEKEITVKNNFNSIGICCFTRNLNSILMWSHYAENHKGFCLEFYSGIDEQGINPLDVHYSNTFIKADFYKDGVDSLFHMIYTKSDHWKYEEELRSLDSNFTDDNSRKVPFRKSDLKAIYLGVRCDIDLKDKILTIVKDVYQNKISVYEGILSPNSFELNWEQAKLMVDKNVHKVLTKELQAKEEIY